MLENIFKIFSQKIFCSFKIFFLRWLGLLSSHLLLDKRKDNNPNRLGLLSSHLSSDKREDNSHNHLSKNIFYVKKIWQKQYFLPKIFLVKNISEICLGYNYIPLDTHHIVSLFWITPCQLCVCTSWEFAQYRHTVEKQMWASHCTAPPQTIQCYKYVNWVFQLCKVFFQLCLPKYKLSNNFFNLHKLGKF